MKLTPWEENLKKQAQDPRHDQSAFKDYDIQKKTKKNIPKNAKSLRKKEIEKR